MTLSDITQTVAPRNTLSTPGEWNEKTISNKLPSITQNVANRLEARSKLRLSVQAARMRAKLPPDERPVPVVKLSPRSSIVSNNETTAKAIDPKDIVRRSTPPPPCSAFELKKDRSLINTLLKETDNDTFGENKLKSKEPGKTSTKHTCGWDFNYDRYHVNAKIVENRTVCTAKASQRRSISSTGTSNSDFKLKINLYDRYSANSVGAIFKFFHYSDLRLYIKQYRRNHSCGAGQKTHLANVSPVYENNMYRLSGSPSHASYYYNARRARDGFVLGVQSTPVTPNIWKANANLPLSSAFRQRFSKEKKPLIEEPILSPRVFVRQNGAFSQFWKTTVDGTPDPSIAITRPPTTQEQRPLCTEGKKENQNTKTNMKTLSSPELHGVPSKETSTWKIMQMITSCSTHSRTDGSDLTTTKECRSPTLDTDSNLSIEKSQDTGATISESTSPDQSQSFQETTNSPENGLIRVRNSSNLLDGIQQQDRPVLYNRTRSILSNMSNLLSYYIETEHAGHVLPAHESESETTGVNSNSGERNGSMSDDHRDNRKQIAQLRNNLHNIASRRSPSRQNKMPSPYELNKLGSLVLLENKVGLNHQKRCNTTPHLTRPIHPQRRDVRRTSPSPSKTGHAGYRKLLREAEQREEDKPILFVKRSHLLPTVSASVEAMKSRQIVLQRRTAHPADSKQFTKITDLLNQARVSAPTKIKSPISGTGRRIINRSLSVPESHKPFKPIK